MVCGNPDPAQIVVVKEIVPRLYNWGRKRWPGTSHPCSKGRRRVQYRRTLTFALDSQLAFALPVAFLARPNRRITFFLTYRVGKVKKNSFTPECRYPWRAVSLGYAGHWRKLQGVPIAKRFSSDDNHYRCTGKLEQSRQVS
jgi:hypothetical protein